MASESEGREITLHAPAGSGTVSRRLENFPNQLPERLYVEYYLGESSRSAVAAARVELGKSGLKAWAATGLEKFEKRGVQGARNGPSEDRKCWHASSWGIHGLRS